MDWDSQAYTEMGTWPGQLIIRLDRDLRALLDASVSTLLSPRPIES
jgi:hypothetical protein